MASGSLRWPVFAELDRRLYSSYDIQALDVIRVMPPGFLYGVGPSSPVPPGETQEIGLTVAGVAACPDSSEILSVFIEFIQMATVTEKTWLPPSGDPAMLPTLTDAAFAACARTLPAAGRGDLLQLLFLIIKTEGAGWAGLSASPETGQWTVSLSRQIRDFANVRDIDDYWSRRYKPWESGHPVSRPATPATTASAPPAGSSSTSRETTNRSAAGTADTVEGRLAGTAPGTMRVPGATRDEDGLASRFAGTSGVQLGSGNVQFNYFYDNPARTGFSGTRLTPASEVAGSLSRGHAFISYVREDSGEADALQKMLQAAGIPVWRDTSSLWPGEDWRAKIRGAISRDALVFIACFSSHSAARQHSYQNEELLLAIDQLRRRRPDDPWLIPVRFDDCDVPDFELGAGRTLASIHRADLFGADRELAARRLVEAVQRLLR
jgi:TIR domain